MNHLIRLNRTSRIYQIKIKKMQKKKQTTKMTKHAYVYIYTSNKNERIWSKHQTYYKMGGFCPGGFCLGGFCPRPVVIDNNIITK